MATQVEVTSYVDSLYVEHNDYWKDRHGQMSLNAALYGGRYWDVHGYLDAFNEHLVTDEGYTTIESMLSQIYIQDPGVVVSRDHTQVAAAPQVLQTLANRWLKEVAVPLKQATRWALIYPFAGLKLVWDGGGSVIDSACVHPLRPWEMIMDRDATTVDDMQYIGHIKQLPVTEAKEVYGNKKWVGQERKAYINEGAATPSADLPDDYKYVTIIEFYDLIAKKVYHIACDDSIQRKNRILLHEDIPYTDPLGKACAPILPLYLSVDAARPLEGSSLMTRMSDALIMKNWLLTMYNKRARTSAPVTLASSRLGEDAIIALTQGIPDAIIPVEANQDLRAMLADINPGDNPAQWADAFTLVQQELDRSLNMPSFSRGVATKATATEVLELQSYASSIMGMSAWEVNRLLVRLVKTYQGYLKAMYDPEEPVVVLADGQPEFLSMDTLEANFRITPVESIASPLGGAIERRNIMQVLPFLQANPQVDQTKLLEQVLRVYDLPVDLLATEPPAQMQQQRANPRGLTQAQIEQLGPQSTAQGF